VSEPDKSEKQKAIAVTVTTLLVALFSPVGIILISHPYGDFTAHLVGVFWTVFIGSSIPIDGGGMVPPTVDPTAGIIVIPMIVLRLLFVFQLYRVYNGQTSRGAALVVGIFSELFLVIINVLKASPTFSLGTLYIPLPILLLVGALLFWRFPPFVPSTPWETSEKSNRIFTPSIDG
jgi:hypothetical protein